jgi:hypothetical protein
MSRPGNVAKAMISALVSFVDTVEFFGLLLTANLRLFVLTVNEPLDAKSQNMAHFEITKPISYF